jgi:hypothetical protein
MGRCFYFSETDPASKPSSPTVTKTGGIVGVSLLLSEQRLLKRRFHAIRQGIQFFVPGDVWRFSCDHIALQGHRGPDERPAAGRQLLPAGKSLLPLPQAQVGQAKIEFG